MEVLSYSPKVEAYVEVVGKDSTTYVDITEDIVSANVMRGVDKESSCDIVLMNKNWKYNNLFTPMDKIVVYATKVDRVKLFSGYITETSKFTLYQSDFRISAKCPIYLLKRFYWDPGLKTSLNLFANQRTSNAAWEGYAETLLLLLTEVGNWPNSMISIGDMPGGVVEWAYRMYMAKQDDTKQLKDMINEFFGVMQTHGPSITSGAIDTSGGAGTGNSAALSAKPNGGSHADGASYHQTQGTQVNCGAASFTIALNMMLGLKGASAYDNVAVWRSAAFGSNSTYNLSGKGMQFLVNEGLANKVTFYSGGIGSVEAMKAELTAGHIVCISSGKASTFRYNDGSTNHYDGHFICFYNYSGGTFFVNDPARPTGFGVPYSEADLAQWLGGRSYHGVGIMAAKGA